MAIQQPPDRRLIGFLAISLALHVLWLAAPLRILPAPSPTPTPTPMPFVAHLAPHVDLAIEPARANPAPKSAVAGRLPVPATTPSSNAPPVTATLSPAPATPTINLDAAIATARAYAHEAQPRTSLDAPKPMLTVEAAVARATEPDVIVEKRGPNGEYVTQSRHSRCVTALVAPHYLQGMTMPTLCEARKG